MFPRTPRQGESYIRRNPVDQAGLDELIDVVGELRRGVEDLGTEVRSFLSRQGTREREAECRLRESTLQTLELLFLRQQEVIRRIIRGEPEADVRNQDSKPRGGVPYLSELSKYLEEREKRNRETPLSDNKRSGW